jgi:hypothetical protein
VELEKLFVDAPVYKNSSFRTKIQQLKRRGLKQKLVARGLIEKDDPLAEGTLRGWHLRAK